MADKRREHDRACHCHRANAGCPALAVQRLSRTRVQELAEEIWTVSTGTAVPVQPIQDPQESRPGASAQAAYRRCRHQERKQWRRGWRWRSRTVAAAALRALEVLRQRPEHRGGSAPATSGHVPTQRRRPWIAIRRLPSTA